MKIINIIFFFVIIFFLINNFKIIENFSCPCSAQCKNICLDRWDNNQGTCGPGECGICSCYSSCESECRERWN